MKLTLKPRMFTIFLTLGFFLLPVSTWAQEPGANDAKSIGERRELVRFGFTQGTMGTINKNDAIAAVRIWVDRLVNELGMQVDPSIDFYPDHHALEQDLVREKLDLVYITAPEWFALRDLIAEGEFLGIEKSGAITEEYVLLVHRDNTKINGIQDLKGGTLRLFDNERNSLAPAWLNHFLIEKQLGRYENFFSSITREKKLNKAVLPVFFKQTDACLATRSGFRVMAELNPQISRQLTPLAISPPYVPAGFCFRRTYVSNFKLVILEDIQKMAASSSGSQLLTIFHMDGMRRADVTEFHRSIPLLESYPGTSGKEVQAGE